MSCCVVDTWKLVEISFDNFFACFLNLYMDVLHFFFHFMLRMYSPVVYQLYCGNEFKSHDVL